MEIVSKKNTNKKLKSQLKLRTIHIYVYIILLYIYISQHISNFNTSLEMYPYFQLPPVPPVTVAHGHFWVKHACWPRQLLVDQATWAKWALTMLGNLQKTTQWGVFLHLSLAGSWWEVVVGNYESPNWILGSQIRWEILDLSGKHSGNLRKALLSNVNCWKVHWFFGQKMTKNGGFPTSRVVWSWNLQLICCCKPLKLSHLDIAWSYQHNSITQKPIQTSENTHWWSESAAAITGCKLHPVLARLPQEEGSLRFNASQAMRLLNVCLVLCYAAIIACHTFSDCNLVE